MIPQELKERPQWLQWYYDDEGTKVPIGTSNDPSTWKSFDQLRGSRIAYVISEDDHYTGIDLDDCIVDGSLTELASEIFEKFSGIAYAEISPSGTGVKLLTRAKKPDGATCQNGKWLECYDRVRFWTVTGNVFDEDFFAAIGDGQEAIDWLCEKWLKQEKPKPKVWKVPSVKSSSLMERATGYVENADFACVGGRNNSAFRLAGHLAAMVGAIGERLSEEEIASLVSWWNAQLTEPLSDKEVASVVNSAMKNGTPREEKPPTDLPEREILPIDWAAFERSFAPDTSELEVGRAVSDPGPFPVDCLLPPGFIGEVAKHTLATSDEPQPILALAGAMCLLSVLTGRKIRNQRDNRTNIFVLGLGPSGCGKERPRKVNMEVLNLACKPELIGANSLGSGHGIESQLRSHPCKLFQLDEIGDLLKAIKKERGSGHLEAVLQKIKMLMTSAHQIYSNSATADAKLFFTIDQPHLVIFGTATPEKFWDNLSVDSIQDGFLGRILPLEVEGYGDTQEPVLVPVPQWIVDQATAWAKLEPGAGNLASMSPVPATYVLSEDARARHNSYCKAIDSKIPKDGSHKTTDALWKRARGRAASLALLFAASRLGPVLDGTIELIDVELSIKVINWITRRTIYKVMTQVSENPFQRDCNRVFEIIAKGKNMDRSALSTATRWLRRKERNEILEHLIESGDVTTQEHKTKTNVKVIFIAKLA